MDRPEMPLVWPEDAGPTSVERAIGEIRAGRPVAIVDGLSVVLAFGVEALEPGAAAALHSLSAGRARLVLPAPRLRRMGCDRGSAGSLALPKVDIARIETLALRIDGVIDAPVAPALPIDLLALELAALSLVLPAVVVAPVERIPAGIVAVDAGALGGYRGATAGRMRIISRAPVPLEGAPETEFVVFRGGEGLRDQIAIVIGKPDLSQPVSVRLHSACLTGDLFGSLKCDCGDQLRGTVQFMAHNGGGVLLYLDQEGRGNGIANKIRAYRLQSQGWDTYDADEVLGFGLDQRGFDFAATMLKQLGIGTVAVMTNNPQKIAALERAGLAVVEARRVHGRATAENVVYLASKRDRAGHFIDLEEMAAHTPVQD
ncbi:MAG: GTP cyclohydrolase II RibA [Alsobacter sp.]